MGTGTHSQSWPQEAKELIGFGFEKIKALFGEGFCQQVPYMKGDILNKLNNKSSIGNGLRNFEPRSRDQNDT
ncbi:hypothetical protein TNCV_4038411 [Trichonephila clavipes]|nr:hypothetical protein TNCV_4038411 [Trichonephila clavipes]